MGDVRLCPVRGKLHVISPNTRESMHQQQKPDSWQRIYDGLVRTTCWYIASTNVGVDRARNNGDELEGVPAGLHRFLAETLLCVSLAAGLCERPWLADRI